MYFIDRNGTNFKACLFYKPYFYLDCSDNNRILEICNFLMRKFEGSYAVVESKEDLDLANHLSGLQHKFIKISFNTVNDLVECRNALR
jgi:DNA polymerase epsilon subunit 1